MKTNKKNGLGAGGIIGIVIGAIIILALPTIGLIFWKRRNTSTTSIFGGEGIDNITYQLEPKSKNGDVDNTETES